LAHLEGVLELQPTPGVTRYRRYSAATREAAQSHAHSDYGLMAARGWRPQSELWDASTSTLVVAYAQAPPESGPAPGSSQPAVGRPAASPDAGRRDDGAGPLVMLMVVGLAAVLALSGVTLVDVVGQSTPGRQDGSPAARSSGAPDASGAPSATSGRSGQPTPRPTPSTRPTRGTPVPIAEQPGPVPRYVPGACRSEWMEWSEARCGDLVVLEDRSKPEGRRISLHVAVLPSWHPSPKPDPIVYLEGGPGGSPLIDGYWLESSMSGDRDLVLFDQRGTGLSEPALTCGEQMLAIFSEDLRLVQSCRDRLTGRGIDLSAYNTSANADDVEELRAALGYDQWNLYGVSYGTRLALEVMRRHPHGVRSAILDSVYPMGADIYGEGAVNGQRAFKVLFDGCAADPECSAAYPQLEERFWELLERAETKPYRAGALFGMGGTEVDGPVLAWMLFQRMYATHLLAGLPTEIQAMWANDWAGLDAWIDDLMYLSTLSFSSGFYYSVQCAEAVPFARPDSGVAGAVDIPPLVVEALGWQDLELSCEAWGVPPVDEAFHEPVVSDIPTLLLAGMYDPITPPSWAERAASTLSAGHVVILPDVAHGALGSSWCADGIVERFLWRPAEVPRTGCVADTDGPRFEVP
jgi:pimeloyl-ACP methyl ester carboxylesterase